MDSYGRRDSAPEHPETSWAEEPSHIGITVPPNTVFRQDDEQGEMADNLESEYNLGRHELDIREESRLKSIQLTDSGPVVWTVNPGELSKELPCETLKNHAEVDCSAQDNT